MLRFIFGRSGSGKSFYIHQKIKELYEHGKEKIMLIVPEQFSFESERQIYKLLGACSAKNIEVYSFSRLSEMIFRTYGRLAGKYATEPQKSILMNVALNEIKDGLNVYQKSVGQKSFIQTMKSLIGEFKSANVTPSILEEISQKIESEPLKNKTNEIALIYSTYDAFLSESYMDSLDKISKAAKKVRGTDFFKGYTIFFDEFKSFTANENEIIEQMISDAEDTYFSLCLDSTEDEKLGIFSVVYETYQKLVRFARQTGTTVAVPIKIKSGARFKNKELSHLEQNIFSCKPSTFKSNEPENIVFAFAQNEYQEAEYALSTIKELVQKNGYRYDDFAIISRDLDTYISALESEFEKYEIPYYMDKREGIEQKALIRFVVLFLRIATQGYNTENILSMLKCGLSPYDSDRISELENYCFVWDIKAKRWLEEFKANPSGFVSVLSEQDEALLTRVNQVREYVVSSVEMFKRKSGKMSSGELSQALYEAIESMGTRQEVEHIIAQSEQNEDLILAQDYVKIWDILMDIMDILAKTVAHVAITPKRYLELFELVTDEYDMGTLPQTLDSVIVGSAERIRTNNPKVTIILGANQGILPFVPEDSGLFSDAERKLLTQTGLEFSGDVQYKILEERFVAYKALTSSSEKLVVTARRSDLTGKAIRPSEIFSFASEVFGSQIIKDVKNESLLYFCRTSKTAFLNLARNYREDDEFTASLRAYFVQDEVYGRKIKVLDEILQNKPKQLMESNNIHELFSKHMRISPSRMEDFYKCNFLYFCSSGLKAKARKRAELSPIETGSLIHDILYSITSSKEFNFTNLSEKELKHHIKLLLDDYLHNVMGGMDDKTARFKYLYNRMSNTILEIVLHLRKEFGQSEFAPSDFELEIKTGGKAEPLEVQTEDGRTISIIGRIDRVDTFEKNGQKYVRVIDYKSGKKKFNLSDVFYGLNLQMLLYLFSIWKNGREEYQNVLPAGVLYLPAKDAAPNLEREATDEKLEAERLSHYKMNGLLLDDVEVLNAMDKNVSGVFIPAKLQKDGTTDLNSSIVTLSQMGKLYKLAEKLICDMATELYQGKIDSEPVLGKDYDPCKYCDYKTVCGIQPEDRVKKMVSFKKEELFDQIEEGEQNG